MTVIYLCLLTLAGSLIYLFPAKCRPCFLLGLSVLFFLCVSPWALCYVAGVVVLTYPAAHAIHAQGSNPSRKKKILLGSLTTILAGVLIFIKYSGLFLSNSLAIPLGLSYYTLMAIGGLIDIYRGKAVPEKNFALYALFLCFFPQVIAGPIGRMDKLAPQFREPAAFDGVRLRTGFAMVLLGLLEKMVIADNLLSYTDQICQSSATGWIVFVAMLVYAAVIYLDFAGYSLIAIGAARIMGIELMTNFDTPFFACSMQEFWRRWHISLSSWFRDYVYFPLGGSRKGTLRRDLNTFIIFLLSGAWHGNMAGYILWGGIHGLYLVIGKHTLPFRENATSFYLAAGKHAVSFEEKMTAGLRQKAWYHGFQRVCVYVLFAVSMIPFYCKKLWITKDLVARMFTFRHGLLTQAVNAGYALTGWSLAETLLLLAVKILAVLLLDYYAVKHSFCSKLAETNTALRYLIYLAVFVVIVIWGQYGTAYDQADFIYGQF